MLYCPDNERCEVTAMFDALYYYLEGSMGFGLVTCGLLALVVRGRERSLRALGCLYIAVGCLFSMSALAPLGSLPMTLDNLVYQSLMLMVGLSLVDLALYLFGDERLPGAGRRLMVAGTVFEAALVLIPLLDYLPGQGRVVMNIEDGLARGRLHALAISAGYAWPLIATVAALALARWRPRDVMAEHPGTRLFVRGCLFLVPLFILILLSLSLSLELPYRLGQLLLELLLLAFFLYVGRNPRFLMRLRAEIGEEHNRRLCLSTDEIALIEERLASLSARLEIVLDEALDLKKLAGHVGVPAYRLSIYFSSRLDTTFPAWRNRQRIDYVLGRMAERPDLTILDISLEAGYRSKATFNEQFAKLVGMSPSEYRRSLSENASEPGRTLVSPGLSRP